MKETIAGRLNRPWTGTNNNGTYVVVTRVSRVERWWPSSGGVGRDIFPVRLSPRRLPKASTTVLTAYRAVFQQDLIDHVRFDQLDASDTNGGRPDGPTLPNNT